VGPVVTLVVTDIVGSTRAWALHGPQMAEDLAAHDTAIRAVVTGRGGSVFKHTGDGAMAQFSDPFAAVEAAAEIQRVIGAIHWHIPDGLQVRVAVNTGSVVERDGDVFGTPVNRVSRLLDLCPAGGVVLGNATAALLTDGELDGLDVRSIGTVELRGLAQPEAVHALLGPGLADVPPVPVHDGSAIERPMPTADDPLVGRGDELKAVWAAVLAHPIVSIVGVGGMGKTRLALEAANGLATEFPDGAWWCDLSVATSSDAVAPVVLDGLATRQAPGRSPVESICDRLSGCRALVVLDNCEHVLDAVRAVVNAVRRSCPSVAVLATGREALGVGGEHVIPLSSLPIDDAVTLFVDRCVAGGTDLDAGPDGLEAARQVCARVDGIPLAVELAAARCRVMSPREVNERLRDRFRLLRSGRPTSERHRTLQAAVAWSYDLLGPAERDLFDRMAVFADGCLVDGVAAVGELDDYDALDLLEGLVARSMVATIATPLGTRYRQLETLRQYAEDRLVERGLIQEIRDRHLHWVGRLAATMGALDGTASVAGPFHRYIAELDNIRVAVAHGVESGQPDVAIAIVADIWRFAASRPTVEIRQWFDPLRHGPPESEAAAQVGGLLAHFAFLEADITSMERLLDAVIPRYEHLPAVFGVRFLHAALYRSDIDEAERIVRSYRPRSEFEHQMVLFADLQARYARMRLAHLEREPVYVEGARRATADFVARAKDAGDEIAITRALSAQAFVHVYSGSLEVGYAAAAESIAVAESVGAGLDADAGRNALCLALARIATSGSRDPGLVADDLRAAINDAKQHNTRLLAAKELDAVAILVAECDSEASYLLSYLSESLLPLGILETAASEEIGPERRSELEARAANMTVDEGIALALTVLDEHFPTGATASP
jgi:predicted ATPase/class 3 adenylate cyclase